MSQNHVILEALTPEATAALNASKVVIDRFPFRVGRESRIAEVAGEYKILERRKFNHPPNNELYLIDQGSPLNISREHFQIERLENGGYQLVDRNSACGTIVGDSSIGGNDSGGALPIEDGNVIVIGTEHSPYVFRFVLVASSTD